MVCFERLPYIDNQAAKYVDSLNGNNILISAHLKFLLTIFFTKVAE